MALTGSKALIGLSQLDLILSCILFIVENLVPSPNGLLHVIVLVTSILSVFLALFEMFVISKEKLYHLLGATMFRLGPLVALSIFWMVCTNKHGPLFPVGGLCLTFHLIKGLVFLIASVDSISHRAKQKKREKEKQKYERKIVAQQKALEVLGDGNRPMSSHEETMRNCWDPLEPAYDIHGRPLKSATNGERRTVVTFSNTQTIMEI